MCPLSTADITGAVTRDGHRSRERGFQPAFRGHPMSAVDRKVLYRLAHQAGKAPNSGCPVNPGPQLVATVARPKKTRMRSPAQIIPPSPIIIVDTLDDLLHCPCRHWLNGHTRMNGHNKRKKLGIAVALGLYVSCPMIAVAQNADSDDGQVADQSNQSEAKTFDKVSVTADRRDSFGRHGFSEA